MAYRKLVSIHRSQSLNDLRVSPVIALKHFQARARANTASVSINSDTSVSDGKTVVPPMWKSQSISPEADGVR